MHGVMVSDGWVLAAIAAKAIGYALALLAVGGTLFIAIFRELPIDVAQLVKRTILWSTLIGALVLALRFGIRAARISGMGIAGMTEPVMLGLVWNSPLGTAALWSGAGWIMMLGLLRHGLFWKGVCLSLIHI